LRVAVFVFSEKLRLDQRIARAKWREFAFISIPFCAARQGSPTSQIEENYTKKANASIVKERTV